MVTLSYFKELKLKIFVFLTERDWRQESLHGYGCHLVSFVMYIFGAKFEECCFNIYSRTDNLYSVILPSYLQTSCWRYQCHNLHNTEMSISLNQKRCSKKERAILLYLKSRSNTQQLFFLSYTLKKWWRFKISATNLLRHCRLIMHWNTVFSHTGRIWKCLNLYIFFSVWVSKYVFFLSVCIMSR